MNDTPFATTFTGRERKLLVKALAYLQANVAEADEDATDEQLNEQIGEIEKLTAKVLGSREVNIT